eukprot:Gb_38298 [translate_table: standard]
MVPICKEWQIFLQIVSFTKWTSYWKFWNLFGGAGHDYYQRKLWEERKKLTGQGKVPFEKPLERNGQKLNSEDCGRILVTKPTFEDVATIQPFWIDPAKHAQDLSSSSKTGIEGDYALHMQEARHTNLRRVTYLVLDEADHQVEIGLQLQERTVWPPVRLLGKLEGNRKTLTALTTDMAIPTLIVNTKAILWGNLVAQGGDHDIGKDVAAQYGEGLDWMAPIRDRNIWHRWGLKGKGMLRRSG